MSAIESQASIAKNILKKESSEREFLPDVETHCNAAIIITSPCYGCKNGQLTKTE